MPIIVLSGRAGAGDKIGALDAGADDYVTKPFVMRELLARLRAKLRREEGNVVLAETPRTVIGRWHVDLASYRITRRGCISPPGLTIPAIPARTTPASAPIEWAILEPLLRRPGQLVGTTELAASVWGGGFQQRGNCLRFHLVQLRRKLEDDPARPRHLLTEHGMGYRYLP